jgi:hypothetical protein
MLSAFHRQVRKNACLSIAVNAVAGNACLYLRHACKEPGLVSAKTGQCFPSEELPMLNYPRGSKRCHVRLLQTKSKNIQMSEIEV